MADEPGTAPVEGAAATTEAPSTPEWAPVLDRVNELATGLEGLSTNFQQFAQANAPEPEAEPDPWASLFGAAEEVDPAAQALQQQQAPAVDPAALKAAMDQAIQQANAPLQAQIAQFQLQQATERLYQQIPQLADTPENAATRAATGQRVAQSLAAYPPHIQQALSNDPNYIATIFKAAEAEKLAAGQAPASGQVPTLEAAGGAHPGGNGEQPSPIQQAHEGRRQLPAAFR